MRKAFLRRVTTRWAASSLARAASERKSGFGVSCSKYSTRHGHQSASISDFGNCIRSFKLDARLQISGLKSSRLFGSPDEEEIAFAIAPARAGLEQFPRFTFQFWKQVVRFIVGQNESVDLAGVPIGRGLVGLEELCFSNVEEHAFVFSSDDGAGPVMGGCFFDNR